jgi:hypothetical protein
MPKWHLAGVIEPSPISFRTALMQQYRAAGVSGTLENKARNVAVFVGVKTWDPVPEWGWTDTLLGQIRVATLRAFALSALLSPLFLLLYWWSPHRRAIGAVGAVIGASSIVFLLLEFGDASYQSAAWLHHGPYSLLILWAAIGAMAAAHSPLWARVLVAFQLVSFVVLWIIDAAHPQWRDTTLGPISPLMTIVQVALLAAMAYLAFRWTGRQAATSSEAPGQVALTG